VFPGPAVVAAVALAEDLGDRFAPQLRTVLVNRQVLGVFDTEVDQPCRTDRAGGAGDGLQGRVRYQRAVAVCGEAVLGGRGVVVVADVETHHRVVVLAGPGCGREQFGLGDDDVLAGPRL